MGSPSTTLDPSDPRAGFALITQWKGLVRAIRYEQELVDYLKRGFRTNGTVPIPLPVPEEAIPTYAGLNRRLHGIACALREAELEETKIAMVSYGYSFVPNDAPRKEAGEIFPMTAAHRRGLSHVVTILETFQDFETLRNRERDLAIAMVPADFDSETLTLKFKDGRRRRLIGRDSDIAALFLEFRAADPVPISSSVELRPGATVGAAVVKRLQRRGLYYLLTSTRGEYRASPALTWRIRGTDALDRKYRPLHPGEDEYPGPRPKENQDTRP